jgi:hypothetical protein
MASIALKVLIALAGALAGAAMLRSPRLRTLPDRSFLGWTLAIQMLLSLGLFVALYVVGGQEVSSDVPGYYLPAAHSVLTGKLPYRDFELSYAPLFPYIGAALLVLWDSGKAFALLAILVNALALILWHRAAVRAVGEEAARSSSVLYATCGHVIVQTLLGTNQVWVGAALAGSSLLLMRGASASSGLVQAASICSTKALALLFWPLLWMLAPQRGRWLAGALLPTGVIYGGFALLNANPFDALRRESGFISPGNLPYLLEPLAGGLGPAVFDYLALTALGATTLWLYLRARAAPGSEPQRLTAGIALTGMVFMLVSKKSFTGYEVFFMYPALLVLERRKPAGRLAFLLLFNVLLVAEPSLWFYLGGYRAPLGAWLHSPGSHPGPELFILLDLALLVCYAWLAMLSLQYLHRVQPHPPSEIARPAQPAR